MFDETKKRFKNEIFESDGTVLEESDQHILIKRGRVFIKIQKDWRLENWLNEKGYQHNTFSAYKLLTSKTDVLGNSVFLEIMENGNIYRFEYDVNTLRFNQLIGMYSKEKTHFALEKDIHYFEKNSLIFKLFYLFAKYIVENSEYRLEFLMEDKDLDIVAF